MPRGILVGGADVHNPDTWVMQVLGQPIGLGQQFRVRVPAVFDRKNSYGRGTP